MLILRSKCIYSLIFLFFPGELHKPGVARPECTKVRKAVVKIRMEDKA